MEFLLNYGLDYEDIEEIYEKYNYSLIETIISNQANVENIIKLLTVNNVDIINDLLLNYIEIFMLSTEVINTKITELKEQYGDEWLAKINEDTSLLGDIYGTL